MILSRFINPVIAAVYCGVSLTVISSAQQEEVQLQFISFPRIAKPKPIELLVGDGKTLEITAPTNRLSRIYRVNRMSKWVIGKSTTDEKGKLSFDVLGEAPAIAAKKQLILIVRKGKKNSEGLELIPLNNNISNFGGGKCFLMNASKVDIAGSIGGEKFALKPSRHVILTPSASNKKDNLKYSNAYIFFRKNNKPEPFFSSVWRLSDKARNLVFIYHEPVNNRLRLHIIRDYITPR